MKKKGYASSRPGTGPRLWVRGTACVLAMGMAMSITSMAGVWKKFTEGAWFYENDDGSVLMDAYTPDGYYVDRTGLWYEQSQVMGITINNRTSFLKASQSENFNVFVEPLSKIQTILTNNLGGQRMLSLYQNRIVMTAVHPKTSSNNSSNSNSGTGPGGTSNTSGGSYISIGPDGRVIITNGNGSSNNSNNNNSSNSNRNSESEETRDSEPGRSSSSSNNQNNNAFNNLALLYALTNGGTGGLPIYNNNSNSYNSTNQNNQSQEEISERFVWYRNDDIDGYTFEIKTVLSDVARLPLNTQGLNYSGVQTNSEAVQRFINQYNSTPQTLAWYDYQTLRMITNTVSSTGETLAEAIYSSWQGKNDYKLQYGVWVEVGDALVRYNPVTGSGRYDIKSLR